MAVALMLVLAAGFARNPDVATLDAAALAGRPAPVGVTLRCDAAVPADVLIQAKTWSARAAAAQETHTGPTFRPDDTPRSMRIPQGARNVAGDPWTFALRILNQAQLRASDLQGAEDETARIYQAAGIKIVWINPDKECNDLQGEALQFTIVLLDRERAEHMNTGAGIGADILGRAAHGTVRAYIFSDRIAAVVADYSRKQVARGELSGDFSLVLGRVMAHELAHLVLPVHGHSETGIMRAAVDLSNTPQRFTCEQVRVIHETLTADEDQFRPAALSTKPSVVFGTALITQDAQTGPHVRSDDTKLRKVIEQGLNQSPTFREIVSQIDRLPGFVYILSSRCGSNSSLEACLDHDVRMRGGYRFLRVNILPGESGAKLLALLAHELQHAMEVLTDESATSQANVEKLYERIGMRRKGVGNFETEAALHVQATVLREARSQARGR